MRWQGTASQLTCACLAVVTNAVYAEPTVLNLARESLNQSTLQRSRVLQPSIPSGSFSARYQYRHEPSGKLLDSALLLVSEYGLRVDQGIDSSEKSLIVNQHEGKVWFVDRQRKISHEVPVQSVFGVDKMHSPEAGSSPDMAGKLLNTVMLSDVAHFDLCADMDALYAGQGHWKGRELQVWDCMQDDQLIKTLLFDNQLDMVVRSTTNDGFVSEYTEFRFRRLQNSSFKPPKNYRAVTLFEFMRKRPQLKRYELSNESHK